MGKPKKTNRPPLGVESGVLFAIHGMKPVAVEWVDSHCRSGWCRGEVEAHQLRCQSLGWVVAETRDVLVLAANITDEDEPQRCGEMTIPKTAILNLKWI
jgi:hypothetical protein